MTWALLSCGVAIVYALHGAWSARVSRRVGPLVAGWALFTFALPLLAVALFVRGVPEVGGGFWPAWGVNTLLNFGASYLFLSALRVGELGITYPLLALTPIFVIPLEWILLGDLPGAWGGLGVALIVGGVYLLNFTDRSAGLLAPFLALSRDPGAVRMLVVAVLWSLGGTLDRVAVLESSPSFYGFMLSAGLAALYLPLFLVNVTRRRLPAAEASLVGSPAVRADSVRTDSVHPGASNPSRLVPLLAVHGVLFAVMLLLQMEALTLAFASYVLSIKRSGAVLAVVIGALAFDERSTGSRLFGSLVTVAGAAVLVVLG